LTSSFGGSSSFRGSSLTFGFSIFTSDDVETVLEVFFCSTLGSSFVSFAFAFAKLSFPVCLGFSLGWSSTILGFPLLMSALLVAFSMGAGATSFELEAALFWGLRLDSPASGWAGFLSVFVDLSYRECKV
jgi:hypothetical protein